MTHVHASVAQGTDSTGSRGVGQAAGAALNEPAALETGLILPLPLLPPGWVGTQGGLQGSTAKGSLGLLLSKVVKAGRRAQRPLCPLHKDAAWHTHAP